MEGFLLNEQTWLQHLKEKRLAYGLSQNRLAVATGITRQYLSDIETGKVKPSEDLQQSLWEALERFNPDAPLEMLFDYVRIRFPTTDVQQVVENILQLKLSYFLHEDYGFYSYSEHYALGDIFVLCSHELDKGVRKAIRAVTNSEVRGLMKVIEELRVENTPLSTSIADHIESFTDYDFAHLLFSNGYVEQSISLEKQLNIIQVADLVLPDKETSFEEYTTMELLSVAMLIVISTFALDFIHTDRSIFKIVDLDEAWSFLQVAQGKTLSMKLVRAGRAMNAGVYFVTQNTDDLLDEKLKNNLGLKFAFRSTDLNEIKKTLAFFGVDPEDENNQKRLRDLENGQCLISDLYGRVGVIQFHPVFEELLHAFDTRPPVRKEV